MMKSCITLAVILQLAVAGELSRFSVQMPYLHPAGVTYRSAPPPGVLTAGPAFRAAPLAEGTTSVAYGPLASVALASARSLPSAAPLVPQQYSDPGHYPVFDHLPAAPYHEVAHAPLTEVDTVHHVPGVADIPVTRYEARHGYIQNVVDVAKAKIATRKIEVRRPAIEKTFYDIEERIVIRPAGSAVVELQQPLSETQKGPTLVSLADHPIHVPDTPVQLIPTAPPVPENPITPENVDRPNGSSDLQIEDSEFDDSDSIAVDNPEIDARSRSNSEEQNEQRQQTEQETESEQVRSQESEVQRDREEQSNQLFRQQQTQQLFQNQLNQILNQYQRRNQLFRQIEEQMIQLSKQLNEQYKTSVRDATSKPEESSTRSNEVDTTQAGELNVTTTSEQTELQPLFRSILDDRNAAVKQSGRSSDVVQSVQDLTPDRLQENQQRLIALLTARGGVTEVGFGQPGVRISPAGDAGHIKARVLSVTPAPFSGDSAGERVHTRRIVISRPIQTVQEVNVVQPFTKVERVAVHQPAILKTAKVDVARVQTSVPLVSKSLVTALPLAYYNH